MLKKLNEKDRILLEDMAQVVGDYQALLTRAIADRTEAILAAIELGYSPADIARASGLTPGRIQQIRKAHHA